MTDPDRDEVTSAVLCYWDGDSRVITGAELKTILDCLFPNEEPTTDIPRDDFMATPMPEEPPVTETEKWKARTCPDGSRCYGFCDSDGYCPGGPPMTEPEKWEAVKCPMCRSDQTFPTYSTPAFMCTPCGHQFDWQRADPAEKWKVLGQGEGAEAEATEPFRCRHDHRAPAVGYYSLPNGCPCFDDNEQWLCAQHVVKLQNNGYPVVPIYENPEFAAERTTSRAPQADALVKRLRAITEQPPQSWNWAEVYAATREAAEALSRAPQYTADYSALTRKEIDAIDKPCTELFAQSQSVSKKE